VSLIILLCVPHALLLQNAQEARAAEPQAWSLLQTPHCYFLTPEHVSTQGMRAKGLPAVASTLRVHTSPGWASKEAAAKA